MAPKAKKRKPPERQGLTGQLKDIIASRGLTPYATAKLAEVDPGVVSRFVSGERDIRGETMDRIALALGLRLVEVGTRGRGRARPPARRDDTSGDSTGPASAP